ncbi:MAG: NAD(P)-binding protein [Campylobacterales bacterium]|nr:NAD(P)-binding protein [Campylobacterales bacterium]
MIDYAVVGSGIGGSTIAAYLQAKGFKTVLFEKEPYLGGCSSTFKRHGYKYNTGATTLVGYEEGHPVKQMFDAVGFTPTLIQTDPAITVIQNGKTTPRYQNLDLFLEALQANYPHAQHNTFWHMVYEINQSFYKVQGYYYSNRSILKNILSLLSYLPLALKFRKCLYTNALQFISGIYKDLDDEYLKFLEAQVLIVAQAPLKEINFLTAALALGYTFNKTYYVPGGFSRLFDGLTASIEMMKRSTPVEKIIKQDDHYLVCTSKEVYSTRNVILNTTMFNSDTLFENPQIKGYYQSYEKLNNHQSSFMLYMTIKSNADFAHHYQLIQDNTYPYTLSNALFVSFSDKDDNELAPKGHYSVTVSIHTDTRYWENNETYKMQKESLKNELIKSVCDILDIKKEQIVDQFAATPKTFARYINRAQLGGNPITMKNFLPKLPSNDTPIEGLYHVGDTVYAAQGWPGVMIGVQNLIKVMHV